MRDTPTLINTMNDSPEARVDELIAYEGLHPSNHPQMPRIIEEVKGNSSEPVKNDGPAKFTGTSLNDFVFYRR